MVCEVMIKSISGRSFTVISIAATYTMALPGWSAKTSA